MKLMHDYILVRMMKRKDSGLILPTRAKEETTMIGSVTDFSRTGQMTISLNVGDYIRFMPFAGFEYEENGLQFRLIHERDVILVYEDDFNATNYQFLDEATPDLRG